MAYLDTTFGGQTILIRSDGEIINLSKFDEVGPICWGFFWVRKGNLYGYMNELGKQIYPCELQIANDFTHDMFKMRSSAIVGFFDANGNPMYNYLDENGTLINGSGYYSEAYPFNNGYAKVKLDDEDDYSYIDFCGIICSMPNVTKFYNEEYPYRYVPP